MFKQQTYHEMSRESPSVLGSVLITERKAPHPPCLVPLLRGVVYNSNITIFWEF